MTAADLSTAAGRLRWAVGAAADAAPDHDDIRTVLAELDAARARVAELEAENVRLRAAPRLVPVDESEDEYPDVSGGGVPYPPIR